MFSSQAALFELFDFLDQTVEFVIGDLHFALDCIDLPEELADPDIHQIHDKLLDYNYCAKQYDHVTFKCHVISLMIGVQTLRN